jgi:phage terminase large subunit-like protein
MSKKDLIEISHKLINDRNFRISVTRENFMWFFIAYFGDYLEYQIADVHKKMFALAEDTSVPMKVIVTFRSSGKSTILSMAYPIWAMLGKQQKKHIILASYTQPQAKLLLENIKSTLETNELLIADHGKFKFQDDIWSSDTLILPKYDTRISITSTGSTIRGARHKKYRPDLFILDDIESLDSVRNKDNRDNTARWLERDVIPAGDKHTHSIILGNLLHRDDLVNRLVKKIETHQLDGKFIKIPLVDDEGNINWKGKYPNKQAIEKEKRRIGDEIAFSREFLLKIISEEDQVITEEMFHYYEDLPDDVYKISGLVAVDLAISEGTHADKTAIVGGYLYRVNKQVKLFILPTVVNKRLNFHDALNTTEQFVQNMTTKNQTYIYAEKVGYQSAFTETLIRNQFYNAGHFEIQGRDKRQRLATTVHPMSLGDVLFPKIGISELRDQLLSFGIERFDDLVDAFSMLVIKAFEKEFNGCEIGAAKLINSPFSSHALDDNNFSIRFPY